MDVLFVRVFSDFMKLFEFFELYLKSGGIVIFLKGVNWKKEVIVVEELWLF